MCIIGHQYTSSVWFDECRMCSLFLQEYKKFLYIMAYGFKLSEMHFSNVKLVASGKKKPDVCYIALGKQGELGRLCIT